MGWGRGARSNCCSGLTVCVTHRGVRGGVSLARAAEHISLRPVASTVCDGDRKCSVFQALCRTQRASLATLDAEPTTGLCRPPGTAGR